MSLTPSHSTERLRELVAKTPASGKKRSIGFLAVVACLGGFLFGYDTGVISGALPYMHLPSEAGGLALTSLEEGLIGGFLLFGCAVGAVLGGRMSDRYGRRHNILLLAVVFFVGVAFLAADLVVAFLAVLAFFAGAAFLVVDFATAFFAVAVVAVAFFTVAFGSFGSFLAPETMFFRSAPGVNLGTAFFLAFMRSPVRGLRTHRASRTRFSKEPNPVIATFSPRATSRVMVSRTLSSASAAALRFPS